MDYKYNKLTKQLSFIQKEMARHDEPKAEGLDQNMMIHYYYPEKNAKGIPFIINNRSLYEETIEKSWLEVQDICESFSLNSFRQSVINLLCKFKLEHRAVLPKDMKEFCNNLLKQPVVRWTIFRPLYGAYSEEPKPISLGIFTIYDSKLHKDVLTSRYTYWDQLPSDWYDCKVTPLLVITESVARDARKADELSISKFQLFDDVLSFMFGSIDHTSRTGVLSYRRDISLPVVCMAKTGCMIGGNRIPIQNLFPLPLTNQRLKEDSNGSRHIWELLETPNLDQMHELVITAIQWVGKGLRISNERHSFLFYCIAIESLLNTGKRESITRLLAENAAFVLGKQYDERISIDKRMRELYKIRSRITHGDVAPFDRNDLIDIFSYAKQLIIKFLIHEDLRALPQKDDLSCWVRKQKYA